MTIVEKIRQSPSPMAVASKALRHRAHQYHTAVGIKNKAVAETELYLAAIRFARAYEQEGGK